MALPVCQPEHGGPAGPQSLSLDHLFDNQEEG